MKFPILRKNSIVTVRCLKHFVLLLLILQLLKKTGYLASGSFGIVVFSEAGKVGFAVDILEIAALLVGTLEIVGFAAEILEIVGIAEDILDIVGFAEDILDIAGFAENILEIVGIAEDILDIAGFAEGTMHAVAGTLRSIAIQNLYSLDTC